MSVRIGLGSVRTGSAAPGPELAEFVDACEEHGVDSVWLADQASAPSIDPVVGLAYAAGRTRKLKLGTGVIVLPGRNPMLVAAQLASLVALAPKRILPSFGLRPASPAERTLFPVPEGQRAAVFDEALTVLRRLLTEPVVTHHGTFFHLDDARVGPLPGRPLDLWLGGQAPAALRRIGRLADGWLGAFLTPGEAAACRAGIEAAAAEVGRAIEDDHYGTNLAVLPSDVSEAERDDALAAAAKRRPDLDPRLLVADGWAAAREHVRAFVDVGVTKFVVHPGVAVASWWGFVDAFAAELLPEQT
ncbi:TIGR03854 family LLM class F420-dependent oxidoreductase [Pseudonocardia broussonetiae]|uniref:TIGR03854 family LLM class F420-dependent oxidoreductase n=1 Tax=Pseudonocardia broussonetiae TaxID=2736640 RepID=A0A6M6JN15_9PSEU|nr:TIGR03854 family LLM class F420-dependent oxidoreductase [Pseudonocardia broussonetiae]QJY48347.1 TIGR03854 family LLM class F420-dependent oxidoreductase [Pseudonocardia broussonetiae]